MFNKIWRIAYEEPPTPEPKTFTQEDIDKLLNEERAKSREQQKKILAEYNALKQKVTLTDEERKEFDVKIKELNDALLTKEEIAKRDAEALKTNYEESIKTLKEQNQALQARYTDSMITRSIIDEAVSNNAFNPEQLVALLKPLAKLTENDITKVKFPDIDDKGKSVTLDFTVSEAVKRMKELPKYQNLFKDSKVSGTGSTNDGTGKTASLIDLAKDPKAYREARAKGMEV